METRSVTLPNGRTLEFEIMPGFYERIRVTYGMQEGEYVDDVRLKEFVIGAISSAINGAETAVTRVR